jgi:hypothetical protein
MPRRLPFLAVLLLAAGCGERQPATDEAAQRAAAARGFVPPETRTPAAAEGIGQTTPITAHVGKLPNDAVDGVGFFDRTDVATALSDAVRDPSLRRDFMAREATSVPVFRHGSAVGAHGCEANACDDHNWTFLMTTDGTAAEACYHDRRELPGRSRWFRHGDVTIRPGACPRA